MKKKSTKVIVSLICALSLVVAGMSIPAFAKSYKISGFSGDDVLEDTWYLGNSQDFDDLEVYPGDELFIPLTANMFDWDDDRTLLPQQAVVLSELRRDIEVRTYVQSGWEALDYVQLDTDMVPGRPFYHPNNNSKTGRTAGINVVFVDELTSVDDVEFKLDIYIKAGKELDDDYRITLYGVMKHNEIEVNDDTDYADISDGSVAHASEYSVFGGLTDFNIGSGVTISKLTWKNWKYYGQVSYKDSSSLVSEDFPHIYSDIHGVYQLKTVNLDQGVNRVTIKPELNPDKPSYTSFYVYGNDMTYLGTTNDELAYSDMYILTYEQLDTFDSASYEESLEKEPTQEEETNPVNIAISPDVEIDSSSSSTSSTTVLKNNEDIKE